VLKPTGERVDTDPMRRLRSRPHRAISRVLAFLTLALWCFGAEAIELKILTTKGFVAFTVEDDWRVLSMQTKPPIAFAIFQVPNFADEGTPESTNLVISLFNRKASLCPVVTGVAVPSMLRT